MNLKFAEWLFRIVITMGTIMTGAHFILYRDSRVLINGVFAVILLLVMKYSLFRFLKK